MHLIPSRGLPGIAVDRQCITLNNVPSPLLNLYPGKFGAGTLKKTRSFPVNVCSAMGCSRLWTWLHSRTCPPSPRRGQCTIKNKRVHPLRNKDSWEARWVGELEQEDHGPWEDLNSQPCRRSREKCWQPGGPARLGTSP